MRTVGIGYWAWGAPLLVAGALLSSCEKRPETAADKAKYNGPLLESYQVLLLLSDSANLQIKVKAPVQQQFESGDQVFPKGLLVTFYGDKGQRVINTLQGNYGKYERTNNLYVVRGKVKVRNEEKNQQLNTEELFYNRQKGTIYTDTAMAVRVETATEILTGFGLEANQSFSRYRILRPTGIFTVEEPAR